MELASNGSPLSSERVSFIMAECVSPTDGHVWNRGSDVLKMVIPMTCTFHSNLCTIQSFSSRHYI